MKKWLIIIGAHIAGIAVLVLLGLHFNNTQNTYPGVTSVLSVAWGIYVTVLNFLYQKNRHFYFFVNRLLMKVSRTHTYWQPAFDFEIERLSSQGGTELLGKLWEALRTGRHGKAEKRQETPSSLAVALDDLFVVIFRVEEGGLHVHLDRKLLVPSHLYDAFRQRFALLAEEITRIAVPVRMRCGLVVSFGDGMRNPYYGYFVNRVPADLLQDFQVSFLLNRNSTCRIEASTDRVSIEGANLTELFEAVNQVLTLNAVPDGVA